MSVAHDHLFSILNSELDSSPGNHAVRVLDVGCGDGELLAFIQRGFSQLHPDVEIQLHGFDIVDHCIDPTIAFPDGTIGRLRRDFPDVPWEERILPGREGEKWPFPDAHFDVVVSNHVLEHVNDHDAFFSEVQRTLKSGGYSAHLFPLRNYIREGHLKLPYVHRIGNTGFLKRYIKVLSLMGLGEYKSRKNEFSSVDEFVNHQICYMQNFTNYLEKRDLEALAKKNRLSLSFKYTRDFYLTKLKDLLRTKQGHKYKTTPSAVVDYIALTTLRYLSSITVFLEKPTSAGS